MWVILKINHVILKIDNINMFFLFDYYVQSIIVQ